MPIHVASRRRSPASLAAAFPAARIIDAGDIVLLDYTVNGDVADTGTALSHAALIRLHVENRWPAPHLA
jgi:hypothetical protein